MLSLCCTKKIGDRHACQRNFLRPFSRARDSAIGRAIAVEATQAIEELVSELGRLDAFVNNAGVNHRGTFLDVPL
jgi:hypothetical protein